VPLLRKERESWCRLCSRSS